MAPFGSAPSQPPVPSLPAYPGWLAAYWQSWRASQPDASLDGALAQVRELRDRGLDDDAFVVACEFMERAAAQVVADNTPHNIARHWPAMATLLVEEVIGVTWSEDSVHWELRLEPPMGLRGLQIAGATISLIAEVDTGAGVIVAVETTAPFDLTIRTEFTTFQERVPAGHTRYLLTYLDRTDIFTGNVHLTSQ